MTENWLPVVGYEDKYLVSDHGRVQSLRSGKYLGSKGNPYPMIRLGSTIKPVHQIVMEAFVGPCPEGQLVRHLDGGFRNNHLSNLVYGTQAENMQDKQLHGRDYWKNKTHCPRNHLLIPPNLVRRDQLRGHRSCKSCQNARNFMRTRPSLDFQEVSDEIYARLMNGQLTGGSRI